MSKEKNILDLHRKFSERLSRIIEEHDKVANSKEKIMLINFFSWNIIFNEYRLKLKKIFWYSFDSIKHRLSNSKKQDTF